MVEFKINMTAEQVNTLRKRAKALGIAPSQYLNSLVRDDLKLHIGTDEDEAPRLPEPAVELLEQILQVGWVMDFYGFCEKLEKPPSDSWAQEKWDAFQKLYRAARSVNREWLAKALK